MARLAPLLIGSGALAVYGGTFGAPFVFDDLPALTRNPSLHHLWPLWVPLSPPAGGLTVSGRPLLNLTFAVNSAISGTNGWSYHAVNLLIHVLAAWTLYGIVRRSPAKPAGLALIVALLWTLHPLQTESVTYIVQRAESLMGLFYLLTLYCFIRGTSLSNPTSSGGLVAEASRAFGNEPGVCSKALEASATQATGRGWTGERNRWLFLSVLSCCLGAATKEVIATAPVVILLYDRTFVADGFAAAFRRRRGYYLALACSSWILLAALVLANGGDRGGSAGFSVGVSWTGYWLTQGEAVLRYLWLALWPHHQVFIYGPLPARPLFETSLMTLVVASAFVASIFGAIRGRPGGFLGATFFLILAPTSLIPGTMQEVVEHRMYLPLACIVFAGGWLVSAAGRRLGDVSGRTSAWAAGALALALAAATFARNAEYRSALSLWGADVARRPGSAQSQASYAAALTADGRPAEAAVHSDLALALSPPDVRHTDLGLAWDQAGHPEEALNEYLQALQSNPHLAFAELNAGRALYRLNRLAEAEARLRTALSELPGVGEERAQAEVLLGASLGRTGHPQEALAEFQRALAISPNNAEGHYDLGNALLSLERPEEARAEFAKTLVIDPGFREASAMLDRMSRR